MVFGLRNGDREPGALIGPVEVIFLLSIVVGGAMAIYAALNGVHLGPVIYSIASLTFAISYTKKNSRRLMMAFSAVILIMGAILLTTTNIATDLL